MRVDHHIIYDPIEWTVDLNGREHMTITTIQRMNSTPENYRRVTNFLHAVAHEWERIRKDIDIEQKGEIE